MIEAFFLTTGWLFWAAVAIVIVFDVLALTTEDDGLGGWAVFLTMTLFVVTAAFTDAFIGVKLAWLALGLFAYGIAGVVWSFKKWIDFIKVEKQRSGAKRPLASDNKIRITTSMALWPFQFIWWVMTWPRHFFTWAYNRLATVYDRVSENIWNKIA